MILIPPLWDPIQVWSKDRLISNITAFMITGDSPRIFSTS